MVLSELENFIFEDKFDKINEVLLFEQTLQGLQASNPALFEGLNQIVNSDAELTRIVKESLEKVKALPQSALDRKSVV